MQLTIEEFEGINNLLQRSVHRAEGEFRYSIERAESRAKETEAKLEAIEKALQIAPRPHGSRSTTWMDCGTDNCSVRVPLQNWKASLDDIDRLTARVAELEDENAQLKADSEKSVWYALPITTDHVYTYIDPNKALQDLLLLMESKQATGYEEMAIALLREMLGKPVDDIKVLEDAKATLCELKQEAQS